MYPDRKEQLRRFYFTFTGWPKKYTATTELAIKIILMKSYQTMPLILDFFN